MNLLKIKKNEFSIIFTLLKLYFKLTKMPCTLKIFYSNF